MVSTMASKSSVAFLPLVILSSLVVCAGQNVRGKRQLLDNQPRIITDNGHMIFQSGTNHNITFMSSSGGGVFIDGIDLKYAVRQVSENKAVLDRLQSSSGSGGGNLTTRLTSLETQLSAIDGPNGRLTRLRSDVQSARTQQSSSLTTINQRLSTLESQTGTGSSGNSQSLGARISQIENRVRRVNTRLRTSRRTLTTQTNQLQRAMSTITQLQTTVNNLQTLLTTNECASNPCANGGTCVDMYNGFMCRCPRNFQGPRCDVDVNECVIYAGTDLGCQNGATCINTHGGFTCQCPANWYGIHCSERHDDCTGASHRELCGHGTCVNEDRVQPGQPKFRCICDEGWTTSASGGACDVDVDECSNGAGCSVDPPVQCINIPGSFACGQCPQGYTGNGYVCSDINECAVNNGGCSTNPLVDCINIRGSRMCGSCPAGYEGDGVTCTYVDRCGTNNGGCHSLATCTNDPAGFANVRCDCPVGYVGNGRGPQGCLEQSQAGACNSSPCQNDGSCVPSGSSYVCRCLPGYTGTNCDTVLNACDSNPCQNGGTCTQQGTGYTCECTSSFTGTNCDEAVESCGAYLSGESGTLQYPLDGYTGPRHDRSCAWVITTTDSKVLTITFTSFNLEFHQDCIFDFLQINDGPNPSSYVIGRYCGTQLPEGGSINSTSNQLYFWYKTDATVTSDGFTLHWTSHPPTCGGRFVGINHGTISSPGYPGNYPNNRDCVWILGVDPGNIINFQFATLALEHHSNCSYDYLEIRDGETASSPVLNTYCSSLTPTPLRTTGPYAYVRFHSDSSSTDTGFHITYANISTQDSACGGMLSGDSGTFTSPNYPQPYRDEDICVWTITVSPGSQVMLTFSTFDLEHDFTCDFDYVVVRDGTEQVSPLLGRFCGSSVPAPLTSTANTMYIEMRTDVSISGAGFQASWEAGCGGTFQGRSGIIQSPNYPENYPHNKICGYLIQVDTDYTVQLTFENFGLESSQSSDCAYDYIEVYNGGTDAAPRLGTRYCGTNSPGVLQSTGNQMYVKFVTDGSVSNLGFRAQYRALQGGCGGVFNAETGTIRSPGHPNTYSHGIRCTWYINAPEGMAIRLNFHTFAMEGPSGSSCRYDYLDIYDNSTMYAESKIGRYCGGTSPNVITSTGNHMVLYMRTDSSVAREGFFLTYTTLNVSHICGGDLTATSGVITSPNYPNNYPHSRICQWTITVPSSNQIELNFTDFETESHPRCSWDYLEMRNGGSETSPLIGRYCGSRTIEPIISMGNQLFLKFSTDASRSARGFRIEYDGATTGCGGDFTAPTGTFTSPNFPDRYPHRTECFWSIIVSQGSAITLVFMDFQLEHHGNCIFDYLEIREGGPLGTQRAKLCGESSIPPMTFITNRLWLRFRTDGSVSRTGFRIHYSSNCNTNQTGLHGVLESPGYPNPVESANCTWVITVPRGSVVNVTFSAFNLGRCSISSLQAFDGPTVSSTRLGQFCWGNTPPAMFSSTGNQMTIKFLRTNNVFVPFFWRARNAGVSSRFRLEWAAYGCGGFLRRTSGTLTTPNYPNSYPHSTDCEWHITVPTGKRIQITVTDFDVENHVNCVYDALEIYSGSDTSGPLLAQICGSRSSPQVVSTSGNQMYVKFRSDHSITGRGFSASYITLDGGCGGTFSSSAGSIATADYPNTYPSNTECEWQIAVDEGHSVQLNITDLVLPFSSCDSNYLRIYNGSSMDAPIMNTFCGNPVTIRSFNSSTNNMFVKLLGTQEGGKMSAVYAKKCGGYINVDHTGDGVISSPNFPGRYPYQSRCVWVLYSLDSSRRISLQITHMDILTRDECVSGYVAFNDGIDETLDANSTNRVCGNTVPPLHTSYGSYLTVIFSGSYRSWGTGFRAVYTSAPGTCGGNFMAASGRFNSPGFPENYPMEADCVWQIQVAPGSRVALSFPMFELDPFGGINDDYLEIRTPNASGQIIGRWIRSGAPENVTGMNGVWIKFRSNELNSGRGFRAEWNTESGGMLTGNSGQLGSPLYPSNYPPRVDYTWTIMVPEGQRIKITFTRLEMESGLDCPHDYLLITDGESQESGVQLARVCGVDLVTTPIFSSSNVVTLNFHSDSSVQGQGFLLNWEAVSGEGPSGPTQAPDIPGCGGTLVATDELQNFTSPYYPDDHPHNLNCLWRISSPPGTSIVANITDISMEGWGSRCVFDYVQFFDSDVLVQTPIRSARSLGRFCSRFGNTAPLRSRSNDMRVQMMTDGSVTNRGFVVTYQKACGGVFTQASGIISSPGFPQNFPANTNCTWTVIVRSGKTIRINFNSQFNIPDSTSNCSNSYVELLNGYDSSSPPLYLNDSTTNRNGRYCGSTQPATLSTTDRYLRVKFQSGPDTTGPGFSLTFSEVSIACGGTLRLTTLQPSGFFTSPGFPENYNHNMDCTWVIIAPPTKSIRIDFDDNFFIEPHSNCDYDFLEFHEGGTIFAPPLGPRLCGNTRPSTIRSTGNVILARFRTDASLVHAGFKATYSLNTCGGHIVATNDVIQSPNYPNDYPNNQDCVWTIAAPEGHYIDMNITSIRLQSSPNCTQDFLQIRDGNDTSSILYQDCPNSYWSPSTPNTVTTSDNTAYIRFKSDNSGSARGFSITFRASQEVCGGDLVTPSGVITSPNYPNPYHHRRLCTWNIQVQTGRAITLTFTDFDLEDARFCQYDFIVVINGLIRSSPSLARLCGSTMPEPVVSSGNTMKVIFRTDGSISGRGFRAEYTSDEDAECGGVYTSAPGNITSPGYQLGNYSHNLQCIWQLQNPSVTNSSIKIWVQFLHLEYDMNCNFDFVEVREGVDVSSPLVNKLCGNRTTNQNNNDRLRMVLPSPNAWIRFRTDMSVVGDGFILHYDFTTCGGVIQADSPGYLSSPNYPNDYDHNDDCAWKLVAPEGTRLRIRFDDFSFENHTQCVWDYLKIQNGGYFDSPVIGKYCGITPPPEFVSQGNEVRIVMKTDSSLSARGFKLFYAPETQACGATYHSNSGRITSPNHPGSYPHNEYCRWYINVDTGYRVRLTFDPVFDLEAHTESTCIYDFVEVFDQLDNGTSVSLGRWCSNQAPEPILSTKGQLSVVFRSDVNANGHGFGANWTAECGGNFTEERGTIYSPNYPSNYPSRLTCNYTVEPPGNKHIALRFRAFELEDHRFCRYDHLSIWSGNNTRPVRLCGRGQDEPITGVGSIAMQFVTDTSISGSGFAIDYYTEECGGVFTEPYGRIRTALHPYDYQHNLNCSWHITVSPDKIIHFNFHMPFEIEDHPGCQYDYVAIYDGPDSNSPPLGRFCGNIVNIRDRIMTTGNEMYINFISDSSVSGKGFSGFYHETFGPAQGCGGVLRQSSGTLSSVDADGNGQYENRLFCRWLIYVDDNNVVTFNISNLSLEPYSFATCSYDALELYDGTSTSDPLVGRFCGTHSNVTLMSSSNVMLVIFRTDASVTNLGFNATFGQAPLTCGGAYNVTSELQTIQSPNYPQVSNRPYRCSWYLDTGDSSQNVRISFTDLQLTSTNMSCDMEFVNIRDDPIGIYGQEMHYCGSTVTRSFDSQGQRAIVIYHSTGNTGGKFQLTYQTANCNKNYTGTSGRVVSPNYPQNYPRNVECNVRVTAPEGQFLALYFLDFNIEPHQNCNYDYLRIANSSNAEFARLCNSAIPAPVFLNTNEALITFKTDNSAQHLGYQMTYVAYPRDDYCGGELVHLNEGVVTSPGYPNNINASGTNCTWIITPSRANAVMSYSLRVRSPPGVGYSCGDTYVNLYNIANGVRRSLGQYCRLSRRSIRMVQGSVGLELVIGASGQGISFELKFSSIQSRFYQMMN